MLYKTIQTSNTDEIDEFLNDKKNVICNISQSSCSGIYHGAGGTYNVIMITAIISYELVPPNQLGKV